MMKKFTTGLMTIILILSLAACSGGKAEAVTILSGVESSSETTLETSANTALTGDTTADEAGSATGETSGASTAGDLTAPVENSAPHDEAEDYTWDSAAVVAIGLNGDAISVAGEGVTVEGSKATITAAGTYSLSGTLTDGQIGVNTESEETVRLILNGVSLSNASSAAIHIIRAKKVILILADGTENTIRDGKEYVFEDPETDEPSAAIFSNADVTVYGNGALTVSGNYNDGISSDDGIVIASGTITVEAADDGIRGKEYVVVRGGNITVTAQGDGLKSDEDADPSKGYILIEAGIIQVSVGGDAINAQTDVTITDGDLTLTSGGGSNGYTDAETSMKGIKGAVSVIIDGGSFNINAADDGLHSNGSLVINGGTFRIASGDDGMHTDATLEINGGSFQITETYEGIESAVITINGGEMQIVASDDGINIAGGVDASGMLQGFGPGAKPGRGPGQDVFSYSGDNYLYINGGYIAVEAAGDGIDVNGAIEMTDGIVVVNGPTEQMNGALDYDGGFKITGGLLVAAGSSGMAQAPDASSSQHSILVNFTTIRAGTLFHIRNSAGEELLTFAPSKPYQSIAFSSPEIQDGETYQIYTGGIATGEAVDGLYQEGSYSGGSELTSLTISGMVTRLGGGGGFRP